LQFVALVEAKGRRFVISEAPTDDTLKSFISFMTKAKVTDVVRVCEETYNPAELISTGIKFHVCPILSLRSRRVLKPKAGLSFS